MTMQLPTATAWSLPATIVQMAVLVVAKETVRALDAVAVRV